MPALSALTASGLVMAKHNQFKARSGACRRPQTPVADAQTTFPPHPTPHPRPHPHLANRSATPLAFYKRWPELRAPGPKIGSLSNPS
jgi:hypothetical protein